MHSSVVRRNLEDFNTFCNNFDIRAIIAAADDYGHAEGYEKEVYALAIMRAVSKGAFGADRVANQQAISALWDRGYRDGFTVDSFKEAFVEFFNCW